MPLNPGTRVHILIFTAILLSNSGTNNNRKHLKHKLSRPQPGLRMSCQDSQRRLLGPGCGLCDLSPLPARSSWGSGHIDCLPGPGAHCGAPWRTDLMALPQSIHPALPKLRRDPPSRRHGDFLQHFWENQLHLEPEPLPYTTGPACCLSGPTDTSWSGHPSPLPTFCLDATCSHGAPALPAVTCLNLQVAPLAMLNAQIQLPTSATAPTPTWTQSLGRGCFPCL